MILITNCKYCNEEIEKKYLVQDRVGFAKNYGEFQQIWCEECDSEAEYHVDDFKAVKNVKFYYTLLILTLGVTLFLILISFFLVNLDSVQSWLTLIAMAFFPITVLMIYLKLDTGYQSDFNRHKMRGYNVSSKLTSTSGKVNIATVEKSRNAVTAVTKINNDKLPSKKKA